jgi:anti-sigma regulatory factor (Ser/Thr protein kinase)
MVPTRAPREFRRRLANDARDLHECNEQVRQWLEGHAVPAGAVYALNVAVEELVSNVIRHAHRDEGRHEIGLSLRLERDLAVLQIEDDGVQFDPTAAPAPDLDGPIERRPVGGLGIHLLRRMSDRIEYRRDGNRNIVTVHVRCREARR